MFVVTIASLGGCHDSPVIAEPSRDVFQVEVLADSVFIPVGDSTRLEARVDGPFGVSPPDVEWSLDGFEGFDPPEIASDGWIRGVGVGTGRIIARLARSETQVVDGEADTAWIGISPAVMVLGTLVEGSEVMLGDFNEAGQALWDGDGQSILWDDGEVRELPLRGIVLGSDGAVLGTVRDTAAYWRDGELTVLTGSPRGLLDDGTVYVERNDTMFTWRDGTLQTAERPVGNVGPEGRVWTTRLVEGPPYGYTEPEVNQCGFYLDGEWHARATYPSCHPPRSPARNGWAVAYVAGHTIPGDRILGPDPYPLMVGGASVDRVVDVNGHGMALGGQVTVATPSMWEEPLELAPLFKDSLLLGAINDEGEILARLGNEIVVLTLTAP